jgi:hypothetical protein
MEEVKLENRFYSGQLSLADPGNQAKSGRVVLRAGEPGASDEVRANEVLFSGCLWSSRLVSGNPFLPPCSRNEKKITITHNPGALGSLLTRYTILMPSSHVDALFCEIEAHAGYGNEAGPAEHLEGEAHTHSA